MLPEPPQEQMLRDPVSLDLESVLIKVPESPISHQALPEAGMKTPSHSPSLLEVTKAGTWSQLDLVQVPALPPACCVTLGLSLPVSETQLLLFALGILIATSLVLWAAREMEHSTVAPGLEKVRFHSNPKEGQCQRMFRLQNNCTHFTC